MEFRDSITDYSQYDISEIQSKQEVIDIVEHFFPECNLLGDQRATIGDYKFFLLKEIMGEQDREEIKSKENEPVSKLSQKIKESKKKMRHLIRVVITDNNPHSSMEDAENVIEYKTYGNEYAGFKTAKVVFGTPWTLPELLVENLEGVMYTPFVQHGNEIVRGEPVPRYSIKRLPDFSQEEIEAIKKRQLMRKSMSV